VAGQTKLAGEWFDSFRAKLDKISSASAPPPVEKMFTQWTAVYLAFLRKRYLANSAGGGEWPGLALSTLEGRRKGKVFNALAGQRKATIGKMARVAGVASVASRKKAMMAAGINKNTANALARAHVARALRSAGWRPESRASLLKTWASTPGSVAILLDTKVLFNALSLNMPGSLVQRLASGVRVGIGGPSTHGQGQPTIADIAQAHQSGKGHLPRRRIVVKPDGPTIALLRRAAVACVRALIKL
jgi:hypothetical protein